MFPGLSANMSGGLPSESLSSSIPTLQSGPLNPGGIAMSGIQNNIPVSIGASISMPRQNSHSSVDQINSSQEDPISSLLKQLQQKQMVRCYILEYQIPNNIKFIFFWCY